MSTYLQRFRKKEDSFLLLNFCKNFLKDKVLTYNLKWRHVNVITQYRYRIIVWVHQISIESIRLFSCYFFDINIRGKERETETQWTFSGGFCCYFSISQLEVGIRNEKPQSLFNQNIESQLHNLKAFPVSKCTFWPIVYIWNW